MQGVPLAGTSRQCRPSHSVPRNCSPRICLASMSSSVSPDLSGFMGAAAATSVFPLGTLLSLSGTPKIALDLAFVATIHTAKLLEQ